MLMGWIIRSMAMSSNSTKEGGLETQRPERLQKNSVMPRTKLRRQWALSRGKGSRRSGDEKAQIRSGWVLFYERTLVGSGLRHWTLV
jgi:hypothetical protein